MPDDLLAHEPEANAAPVNSPASNAPTLGRIAVRVTVWTSLGTYANQIIGFVATLVMTRLLDPSVFGTFALATFWFTLLSLRPKAGISYSAMRQLESNGTLLGTYWGLDALLAAGSLLLSVVTGLVLLWLNAALPSLNYSPLMIACIIVLMLADAIGVIVSPLSLILEKEMQISRLMLVSLAAAFIAYAVAVIMALSGAGIGALLAVNIITALVSLVGIFVVCRRRLPQAFRWRWHFDRHLARRLVRDGLPTGMSLMTLGAIVTQFDNFLIGTFVDATTLGYYDRAYRIAHWPNILLTTVITRVGFLTFAKVRDDKPRLTEAVRLSLWILLTLGIPIALVLFFGAADVITILYTSRYAESAYFLPFLTIYSLVWPFVSLSFWLSAALGHGRQTVFLMGTQAVTLIALGTPLTLRLGAFGTVLAVMITMLIAFGLAMRYAFKQVPLSLREVFGAHLAAAAGAILVLLLLRQMPGWDSAIPLVHLMVIGMAGCGTFMLILVMLRPAETRERIVYIAQRFRASSKTA
jgi:lipopolysaccharide exporter